KSSASPVESMWLKLSAGVTDGSTEPQTVRTKMAETHSLPMLPLDDVVVLPGMVVPLPLSDAEVRAAVEAAQASTGQDGQAQVLLVPRLDGKYSGFGTVGVI